MKVVEVRELVFGGRWISDGEDEKLTKVNRQEDSSGLGG